MPLLLLVLVPALFAPFVLIAPRRCARAQVPHRCAALCAQLAHHRLPSRVPACKHSICLGAAVPDKGFRWLGCLPCMHIRSASNVTLPCMPSLWRMLVLLPQTWVLAAPSRRPRQVTEKGCDSWTHYVYITSTKTKKKKKSLE